MQIAMPDVADFAQKNGLPDFIFNSTLYTDSTNLWRRHFETTPFGFGSDSFGYFPWSSLDCTNRFLASLNLQPAIDGAVVCNDNMREYHQITLLMRLMFADLVPTTCLPVRIGVYAHSERWRALGRFGPVLSDRETDARISWWWIPNVKNIRPDSFEGYRLPA